ncbi:MAG: DUF4153 domain-containing protein [Planctomycetota bacterium]
MPDPSLPDANDPDDSPEPTDPSNPPIVESNASKFGPEAPSGAERKDATDGRLISESQADTDLASPTSSENFVVGRWLLLDICFIAIWVAMTDFLVYRHGTFLAWSLQFLGVLGFFAFAGIARRCTPSRLGTAASFGMLALICVKLIWCGSWLQVACGVLLAFAYAMALRGTPPFIPEIFAFLIHVLAGAVQRVLGVRLAGIDKASGAAKPLFQSQFLVPLVVVLVFSAIFVMANPNVARSFLDWISTSWKSATEFVFQMDAGQLAFWFGSAWLMLGMLYPAGKWLLQEVTPPADREETREAALYAAYRNTLLSVIILFSGYLVFEFITLGTREFPDNFYYAGYAHKGAFWLTVALALSTIILSEVFRRKTLLDPRIHVLRRLAIAWSGLNLLLSIAVYNRMLIYVDYNGLTRMRIIGFLGITCVLAGFIFVLIKILRSRSTIWLLHRQAWLPVLAIITYAILPVDWLVNRYNVSQVVGEELAPATQLISQTTTAAGMLPMFQLIDHPTPEVREGTRALLAVWALDLGESESLERPSTESTPSDTSSSSAAIAQTGRPWESSLGHSSPWILIGKGFSDRDGSSTIEYPTSQGSAANQRSNQMGWQWAEEKLRQGLRAEKPKWLPYAEDPQLRVQALNRYFQFAYQWY